jgi:hypothetical protein
MDAKMNEGDDVETLQHIVELVIAQIENDLHNGFLVKGTAHGIPREGHVMDEDTVDRIVDAVLAQIHFGMGGTGMPTGSTMLGMVRGSSNDLGKDAPNHVFQFFTDVVDHAKNLVVHPAVVAQTKGPHRPPSNGNAKQIQPHRQPVQYHQPTPEEKKAHDDLLKAQRKKVSDQADAVVKQNKYDADRKIYSDRKEGFRAAGLSLQQNRPNRIAQSTPSKSKRT